MDLTINRAHARLGRREDSQSCPTVFALRCAGFKDEYIDVDGDCVQIGTGEGTKTFDLPATLQEVITAYDEGEPFRVGTYRIPGLKRPRNKERKPRG